MIKDLNVFNKDARAFEKFDDYNFFYMYNPCSSEVLEPIIKRFSNPLQMKKQLFIIFLNMNQF